MKNLLLFTAMLFACNGAIAQLYVAPNGGTDSYIYVDNEVLFVEQDVNLVDNGAGTTRASIYLRNQAQMLQGLTASSNDGDGFLSIMQNAPDDDAWDYTFWGSPVGRVVGSPGSGNVNAGILVIHDSLSVTNSTMTLTTAGYNGSVSPLTISTRWLYKYPNSTAGWQRIYAGENLPAGLGFTMKGVGTTNHNQIYDFRGRPNNGTITLNVVSTGGGFNLAGNPYPSALDLNRVFYDPANSEIFEFRFWEEDRTINSHFFVDNKGGYATWVPGADDPNGTTPGTYTPAMFLNYDNGGNPGAPTGGSGGTYERRFAPVGQGFMIDAGSTGTIQFNNSHRRYIVEGALNNSQFRQPGGGPYTGTINTEPDERSPHIRFNVFFGDSHYRQMVLMFDDDTTDDFDRGWDGRSPMDATSEAYFPVSMGDPTDIQPLVISTVPFAIDKRIPFGITIDENGMKVGIQSVELVNFNNDAWLYDSVENTYSKFTDGHTAEAFLDSGIYDDRFFIVFEEFPVYGRDPLVVQEEIAASIGFFQNNPSSQLEISNPDRFEIATAQVFDMSGKLVINENGLGDNSRFTFSTANMSDGVYLVKLSTVDNHIIDYRITVHNKR